MTLHRLSYPLLLLGEHCYLDTHDECYFIDEYECRHRTGLRSSIISLKQSNPATVVAIADELTRAIPTRWAADYTFVAMPSSNGTPGALCSVLEHVPLLDRRRLLIQHVDTPSSHHGWRPSPAQRMEILALNEPELYPSPQRCVAIVDDVLATGSHFRAAKALVRQRWPKIRVIGIFLARVCSRYRGHCYFERSDHGKESTCRTARLIDSRRSDSAMESQALSSG